MKRVCGCGEKSPCVAGGWLTLGAFLGLGWILAGVPEGRAADDHGVFPGDAWIRKEPAAAGLRADPLEAFRAEVGGRGCVTRDGFLVFAWGDYDQPHDVASAIKPLYSFLLMKAVEEGILAGFDEPVMNFEPCLKELNAGLGHKDRRMTFRHLGFQTACLGYREVPGTAFDYNDHTMALFWDTLLNRVYGVSWAEAEAKVIRPRLSGPLQFQDGTPGVNNANKPGRFAVSARDFCRFGLLFLHQGNWNGRQILRRDLAIMAVTDPLSLSIPRTKGEEAETCPTRSIGGGGNQTDHNGGYSWMWWLNRTARDGKRWFEDVPDDFFACFGHGGEEGMAVLPTQRLVVSWIGRAVHQDRARGNRAFRALVQAVSEK